MWEQMDNSQVTAGRSDFCVACSTDESPSEAQLAPFSVPKICNFVDLFALFGRVLFEK